MKEKFIYPVHEGRGEIPIFWRRIIQNLINAILERPQGFKTHEKISQIELLREKLEKKGNR